MDLAAVENDIVAKLITEVSDTSVDIRSWPENPIDYQLLHSGGALLVRYNGSNYAVPEPNRQPKIVQDRQAEFVIAIIQKSLKKFKAHQGIYSLLETVRAALTGYTITGLSDASVIYPTGDSFTQEESGTWIFSASYAFTYPEAEA